MVSDKNAHYTIILNDGNEFEATLIASKKDTDIAFLQIHSSKKNFPALAITAKNTHIELWQFSVAIGNALSQFDNSVSFGIISWINRNIQDNYMNLQWLIQTDTAINPWNSWWPLIWLNGKVLWINTLILDGSNNIGFAIPINQNEINEYIKKISIAYSQ